MKSRITIEVDFDNNNSSAIFVKPEKSDDVRDKLISDFIEQFGGQSNWCRADFDLNGFVKITPIRFSDLAEQSKLMDIKHLSFTGESFKQPVSDPPTILHEPVKHPLDDLLRELKFGRPKDDQDFLDDCIKWLEDRGAFQKNSFWVIEYESRGRGFYLSRDLDKTSERANAMLFYDKASAFAFLEKNGGDYVAKHT